jgi:hypothetical protein
MFTIEMLPANEGDALWIEYGPDKGPISRILIDCGRKQAYRVVAERLAEEPTKGFELFVLTHVDADHIEGGIPLLQDPRLQPEKVGDVWFNEYRHLLGETVVVENEVSDKLGAQQGEYFAAVLRSRGFHWNRAFEGGPVRVSEDGPLPVITLPGGMKLTILAPDQRGLDAMRTRWEKDLTMQPNADKQLDPGDWEAALELLDEERRLAPDALGHGEVEWPPEIEALAETDFVGDESKANGSSIAFVAEYAGKRVLFAGDAHAPVLQAGIERMLDGDATRLRLDVFKISHHGSQNNLSLELLNKIDCSRYMISTSGARHHHPDPEAIARILTAGGDDPLLLFNYDNKEQSRWDDDDLRDEHGYRTEYPDTRGFLKVIV